MHMHMHIHIHIHIRIHIRIHICAYMYMYMYICIYVISQAEERHDKRSAYRLQSEQMSGPCQHVSLKHVRAC